MRDLQTFLSEMPVGAAELNVFCLPDIKVKGIVTEVDSKVS